MSKQRTIIFKHEDEEDGAGIVGPVFWADTQEFVNNNDKWITRTQAKALCESLGANLEEF